MFFLLCLAIGGAWWYWRSNRPSAALAPAPSTNNRPAAGTAPRQPPIPAPARPGRAPSTSREAQTPGCWSPSGLQANELQQTRHARFTTVEQLVQAGGDSLGGHRSIYRVQARLLSYQLEPDQGLRLILGSLVNPDLQLAARIPAGRCVAQPANAALFDELREDISLHFGPPTRTRAVLSKPVEVLVTAPAAAARGAAGVVLEPVLDFHVQ